MESHRRNCRHRFVVHVTVSDDPTFHNRPQRDEVLEMARRVYPGATDQRLLEVLVTHSQYPYGDAALWEQQLLAQKEAAATIFPT
jgi:hypothetical protein